MVVLSHLHSTTKEQRLLLTSIVENSFVEIKFREGYGLIVLNRSLFDVLVFKGMPDTNGESFLLDATQK